MLEKLKKHFDFVDLVDFNKYNLLVCRDKAPFHSNMEYVSWLELKIAKQDVTVRTSRSDEDIIEKIVGKILDWVDILKNPIDEQPKQLSLFEDVEEDILMPKKPVHGEEKQWDKYFKESNNYNKMKLRKKYNFLELFNVMWYEYNGINYTALLPSEDEVKELFKKAIKFGKNKPGRYDEFWFDTPSYFTRDGALSDVELIERLHSIRVFLMPYNEYFMARYDDSYTDHSSSNRETETSYRFYLDGCNSLSAWGCKIGENQVNSKHYENLFDDTFLQWVREEMNIGKCEALSDEDMLKDSIQTMYEKLITTRKLDKKIDLKTRVNKHKDCKTFVAEMKELMSNEIDQSVYNCGSIFGIDRFSGTMEIGKAFNKCLLLIKQKSCIRRELDRNIDLEFNSSLEYEYVVYSLTGKEIWEKAFEMFKTSKSVQTFLDFAA